MGAPPEAAGLLDEIQRQSDDISMVTGSVDNCLGSDPELDEFMVSLSLSLKFLLVLTETLVNFNSNSFSFLAFGHGRWTWWHQFGFVLFCFGPFPFFSDLLLLLSSRGPNSIIFI